MESTFYRDTWVEINLDHIKDNVSAVKGYLAKGVQICAVVKANAYGHGDIEVAKAAIEAGATCLATAFLDEAIALRKKGIIVPILVLGAIRAADVPIAAAYEISATVYNNEWLQEAAGNLAAEKPLRVHIKCDTGMGRLGYKHMEDIKAAEKMIMSSDCFELEGIYTHFATADELDLTYYHKQLGTFKEMVSILETKPPIVHCSNSAASLRFEEAWYNAIRLGISMYGLSPSPAIKELLPVPLKEAFSLHSRIVHVKKIKPGESVGYGATYTAAEEEWIATIPIGYADGWLRKLQGQEVLVDGQKMPIVGRICMDQCMIRLPRHYPEGTKVTLIGENNGSFISVDEIAAKLSTINYEVVCMINQRVPRVYVENEKISSIRNPLI
ncbi:alanine racemase [Bacillus testis]|uniref:alanine racemase n=1 Tax=Bacillus testis TaxID=1622072 RepID=UPI00067EF668|nr:alanine racemase [Bacillus testis]